MSASNATHRDTERHRKIDSRTEHTDTRDNSQKMIIRYQNGLHLRPCFDHHIRVFLRSEQVHNVAFRVIHRFVRRDSPTRHEKSVFGRRRAQSDVLCHLRTFPARRECRTRRHIPFCADRQWLTLSATLTMFTKATRCSAPLCSFQTTNPSELALLISSTSAIIACDRQTA